MLSKLNHYFNIADSCAQMSHDKQTKVGSLLVKKDKGTILVSAYNGFVRQAPDDSLPTTRPEKYKYIIHSEVNLICNAASNGVNTSDCFVVCTLSPCINCLRVLWQASIDTIYFRDTYHDFNENINMEDLKVTLTKVGKYSKIQLGEVK